MVDAAWSAGAVEGTEEGGVEESSGVEEVCRGSLLLKESKNLPPGGFENRE